MLSAMKWLPTHLRNKFLAGALAAGPLVVLVWGAVWLEQHTRPLAEPFGIHFPGLGILMAVAGVYLLGVLVTSVLGAIALRLADRFLVRIPGFNLLYQAWKDVLVLPPSKASIFSHVVLVPDPDRNAAQLGFICGEGLPTDSRTCCVFLPSVPNPLSGELHLVGRETCVPLAVSVQEAFKFLLSNGNYLPAGLRGMGACEQHIDPANRIGPATPG